MVIIKAVVMMKKMIIIGLVSRGLMEYFFKWKVARNPTVRIPMMKKK
ncbi:MAG: hypothetical protein KAT32_01815 [Candidatus Moranbacteria bacterium]|nr:hypothetical protein [Candidatus Moranbacteria bacterium]